MLDTFFRTHRYLIEHTQAPVQRALMNEIDWHHRLTGSCEMGRRAFAERHNVDLNGSMTVAEFIRLTENDYGGNVIRKLRAHYEVSTEARAEELEKKC